MKYFKIIAAFVLATLFACSSENDRVPDWEWGKPDPGDQTEKPRFIWIDAAANFPDFANNQENIFRDLKRAKEAGFTAAVVDVRPTCGDVLFQSEKGHSVEWLGAWLSTGYSKVERTATFDYLQAFIDAGKKLDIAIYAGFNTFVAGTNNPTLGANGRIHTDQSMKGWATDILVDNKVVSAQAHIKNGAIFINPANEQVENYLLSLLEDLAKYKGLKGIILDRARYYEGNKEYADFSEVTKKKFEAFIGYELPNFPLGIVDKSNMPLYRKWLEFRVSTIYNFISKAQKRVKQTNTDIDFGAYVGGWYSSYYGVGVNWASQSYDPSVEFPEWASKAYYKYGYADLMDIMLIGAYATPTSIYGSNEWSVQGFCKLAKKKIGAGTLVVGGPDVGNGKWATETDAVVTKAITQSVDAAIHACDGYFLFDMIHLKKKNQWKYVKEGIDNYLKTIEK